MHRINLLKGFFYSLISAVAFGSLIIFVKLGYDYGLGIDSMLTYRFGIGAFVFAVLLAVVKPGSLKPSRRLLFKALFVGGVLYTSQAYCFFSSVRYVSPSVSELLLYLYPAFVTILAAFVFKEKITIFKAAYISVIMLGFVFIFHSALHSSLKIKGVIFGLLAMAIYSLYLLVVEIFVKREDALKFVFYTILFASFGFFAVFGVPPAPLSVGQIGVVVALGVLTTVIAIGALFLAIKEIGSSLASVFSSIEPVVTIFLSALIFDAVLKGYQLLGGVLIIAGVFLANLYHLLEGGNR